MENSVTVIGPVCVKRKNARRSCFRVPYFAFTPFRRTVTQVNTIPGYRTTFISWLNDTDCYFSDDTWRREVQARWPSLKMTNNFTCQKNNKRDRDREIASTTVTAKDGDVHRIANTLSCVQPPPPPHPSPQENRRRGVYDSPSLIVYWNNSA